MVCCCSCLAFLHVSFYLYTQQPDFSPVFQKMYDAIRQDNKVTYYNQEKAARQRQNPEQGQSTNHTFPHNSKSFPIIRKNGIAVPLAFRLTMGKPYATTRTTTTYYYTAVNPTLSNVHIHSKQEFIFLFLHCSLTLH